MFSILSTHFMPMELSDKPTIPNTIQRWCLYRQAHPDQIARTSFEGFGAVVTESPATSRKRFGLSSK